MIDSDDMIDPDDPATELGEQQDSEIDTAAADPREPDSQVGEDQTQEIDPEAPAPR
ncbi:MAG: hypothetical protein V9E98_09020 [Candidatus Nanopelagicales bacterium]